MSRHIEDADTRPNSRDEEAYRLAGRDSIESEEKGEEESQEEAEVGFFDPGLNGTRLEVFKGWAKITLILCTFILGILSLYWGVLFHTNQNLSALVVWVVDFDGQLEPYKPIAPIVGPEVVRIAEAQIAPTAQLGWGSLPISYFNNDPLEVRRQIWNYKAWAAVIINANATALLQEAVRNGNASYDPMGALQVLYVEARDETTYRNYVLPLLRQFEQQVSSQFGTIWSSRLLSQLPNSHILNNLQTAPQALNPGIAFSTYNLRPFNPPQITPSVSIGLIYLIIIAFFSSIFYMPFHLKLLHSPSSPPLKFLHFVIYRWLAAIGAYFFLSLCYSLVSLAFQIPFSQPSGPETEVRQDVNRYHYASFFVYWMLNFVGMSALGLACENVMLVVGLPWTAMWLIFWVITNVSTSFYRLDLAPSFYNWGYAWPLHNVVEGSRTILFDVHSELGLNFGVLFAWCGVGTALLPLCCMFQGWKSKRAEKKGG